jgi:hypothetical protein
MTVIGPKRRLMYADIAECVPEQFAEILHRLDEPSKERAGTRSNPKMGDAVVPTKRSIVWPRNRK